MATKPTTKPTASTTKPNPRGGLNTKPTKSTKPAPSTKPTAAASLVTESMLARTFTAVSAVKTVETEQDSAVMDVAWRAFDANVNGLKTFAKTFTAIWSDVTKTANVAWTANAITAAWSTAGHALYVKPDARGSLPTKSTLDRALVCHIDDTAARRAGFKNSGNQPTIKNYLPYLTEVSGRKTSNASTVDRAKSIAAAKTHIAESGVKVAADLAFKVTRKPVVRVTPPTAPVTTTTDATVAVWGVMSTLDDAALAAVPTTVDLSGIPTEKLADVARQIVAAVILAERAAAKTTPALTMVK